jgi:hypothetical protein
MTLVNTLRLLNDFGELTLKCRFLNIDFQMLILTILIFIG